VRGQAAVDFAGHGGRQPAVADQHRGFEGMSAGF
jgi:hypothetical protein